LPNFESDFDISFLSGADNGSYFFPDSESRKLKAGEHVVQFFHPGNCKYLSLLYFVETV